MFATSRAARLAVALVFVFVAAGAAAQQGATAPPAVQDKAGEALVCPVSGEPAQADISWEYKGKTYYFCCEGCRTKFQKDPELFLLKKAEAKPCSQEAYVCPMCKGVKSDKPGKCPKCGMELVKAEPGKDVLIRKVVMEGPHAGQGHMEFFEAPVAPGMMPMGMKRHRGLMGGCPMMNMDVDYKVDYTKDGVVITLTSKDPDTVKIIQGHAAMMKHRCQAECQNKAVKKAVVIKEEPKKEAEKK